MQAIESIVKIQIQIQKFKEEKQRKKTAQKQNSCQQRKIPKNQKGT